MMAWYKVEGTCSQAYKLKTGCHHDTAASCSSAIALGKMAMIAHGVC